MQTKFWLALAMSPGIGNVTIKKFYTACPQLTEDTLFRVAHITKKLPTAYELEGLLQQAQQHIDWHQQQGIEILSIASPYYPKQLRNISDPPAILYIKGNINSLKGDMVALVGTRTPTLPAQKATQYVAEQFVHRGYTIISGLARGIDTVAHQAALAAGGKTIAVLAGGLGHVYPIENTLLAQEIIQQEGLLISEVPIETPITRGHFAARNRIQSGLAFGVCPIQGSPSSGTLHTIKAAIRYNRLLFYPKQDHLEAANPVESLIQQAMNKTQQVPVIELRQQVHLDEVDKQMKQLKKLWL